MFCTAKSWVSSAKHYVVSDNSCLSSADIDSLDLITGKMMEQGPVLVISFNSQQVMCVKDKLGNVMEGSEDKVRSLNSINLSKRAVCVFR